MDLIKKKFEKKKKKNAEKKKKEKQYQKRSNTQTKTTGKKKKKKKKDKKRKRNSRSRDSSSSEESESSDESQKQLKAVQSKLAIDAANIDKKYHMTGALIKKPEDPPNFARKLLEVEWKEMIIDPSLTNDVVKTLDVYLKNQAELKSTDYIIIAEKTDDYDKKETSRLKILTKYDEGRFSAIYMVQNESAVDNDVVSVGNGRLMMKTGLRQLSSRQIINRLSREINVLKTLWSKTNDLPQRIPPLYHHGRMIGVPFYVTNIYDVNLEKCREQMGGGSFSVQSAFHIAQEIFLAIKFLHRRQLVHRDIKPTNIVLSYQNRDHWYLIDYGDTISVGKNSALSPPDGITLPFLSLEAHDLLNTNSYSSFQQDTESWFYVLVDLLKPLPWRNNNKIEQVATTKREFLKNIPNRQTEFPAAVIDIARVLRTDTPPVYSEISRKITEGLSVSRNTSSGEKWIPEWYDRAATKKLKEQKALRRKKSREVSEAETTATITGDSLETQVADKKDKSVYATELRPVDQQLGNLNRKKVSTPPPNPGSTTNRMAVMVDDEEPQRRSPVQKQQERSVYFTDIPIISPDNGAKKKYRYKPRK
ncbi:hypothetical protein CRE_05461 [Caenorhabditis remanei]|uniref:non-specific serine/threonine protein kinase n=1 Tax=Caenorhabditis remanei TaxID=31234 RepID=E3M0M9_CAERE|nr:hypothetical protein CRE_05461 [Caenorhabditis remanei]